jgi:hypothetical protein
MKIGFVFAFLYIFALLTSDALAQTSDKLDALAQINKTRAVNGVPPLAYSVILDKAAQRHADDMSRKGFVDTIGSDGSTPRQRIEASGYPTWRSVRPYAESIYAGKVTFAQALAFLLDDDGQRRPLLSPRLREVGVGVATDGTRTYWAITYGSQPNVLPIFINDGATTTNNAQVAIQLTQEEAVAQGEGNAMGRAIEIRASDKPNFDGAQWQPFERLIPFTFDKKDGVKTVYVQYRDGVGRTATSSASINFDSRAKIALTPIGPGAVETVAVPTEPVNVIQADTPTPTEMPPPTNTPIPPATPTAVQPDATLIDVAPTASPRPVESPAAFVVATPIQTTPSAQAIVFLPQPTVSLTRIESPLRAKEKNSARFELPSWVVPFYVFAQIGVIVIGLVALLKRK